MSLRVSVFKKFIFTSIAFAAVLLFTASAFAQPGGVPNPVGSTTPSSGEGKEVGSPPVINGSSDPLYSRLLQNLINLQFGRGGGGACIAGPNGPLCGSYQNGKFSLNNSGTGVAGISGPYVHQMIDSAACRVLAIPQGSFGALVMIVTGVVAIVSGALGAYKMALSTLTIGIGSWILAPIVALFFPISCA